DAALLSSFSVDYTALTGLYTLSLHDALPIWRDSALQRNVVRRRELVEVPEHLADVLIALIGRLRQGHHQDALKLMGDVRVERIRSEEHTSELQSRENLVCRLLLETTN